MLTTRAVDGSSRVRFVPKPNSTLQLWVGKILTESAESDRIGFGCVSVLGLKNFGRNLAGSHQIWPNLMRSS